MNQLVPKSVNFSDLVKTSGTTLSLDIQSKMVDHLNETFTETEQQWYIANLFVYMHYHPTQDYPINLEHVFKMLGFAHKKNAKRTLENNFTENDDYKTLVLPTEQQKANDNRGGHNKETIMLNIDTFKNLCMMVKTDKGKAIRKYYVKLENIYNKIIKEDIDEQKTLLKLEMEKRQKLLTQDLEDKHKADQLKLREKTLLEQFPKNTLCVYIGIIGNTSTIGERLVKFGISNDLNTRVGVHKNTYQNFCLVYAFKVDNHIHIENEIKSHPTLKRIKRSIIINNKSYTELIALNDEFTLDKIKDYVKEIITNTQYNLKNYQALIDKYDDLQSVNFKLNDTINELNDKITKYEKNQTPDIEKTFIAASGKYKPTKGFYSLYAFQTTNHDHGLDTFKVGMCRKRDLEHRTTVYKMSDPNGNMAYTVTASLPLSEKIMLFLCKKYATFLRDNTFECEIGTINHILNSTSKLEELINNYSIEQLLDFLDKQSDNDNGNPENTTLQKARRPVVQLNKDTKEVIATYPSLVAAGKGVGCSDTAVGIALRNKSLCKGFLFAYSGISVEDQMKDQPVLKINCSTAERVRFDNIAAAARDIGISAPGLRQRILTNCHRDGFHWVFDKNATHYT